MNNSHVKGSAKELKGKIKEEVGHVTGKSDTAAEGVLEQVAGKAEKAFGDIKDAVKNNSGEGDHLAHRVTQSVGDGVGAHVVHQ